MAISRSLTRTPAILTVLIVGACIGLSALGLLSWAGPKVRSVVTFAVEKYDMYFPAIILKDGHASIKEPQPYFVDLGKREEATIVIDTRPGHENDALGYLKDARNGFVLSRDSLFTKNRGQIRIIPLKNIPDLVVNAQSIHKLVDRYLPRVTSVAAVAVVSYYLLAKLSHLLLLALIPYFWARSRPQSITYGQALKLCAFCMIPPVLIDAVQDFGHVDIPLGFLLYFVLFVGLLIVASVSLVRSPKVSRDFPGAINP